MGMSVYILLIWTLSWTIRAGINAHDSRDPHSAFRLFNWAHDLAKHEKGTNLRSKSSQKYGSNFVTDCPPNVVFVLDGSDSVSPGAYRLAKESVVREIRAVTHTFANTDVGVILFSDVTEQLPLQHRTSAQIDGLTRQVQSLQQPRRETSMSAALKTAREMLLDYSVSETRAFNGVSSGKVIVLLSDGIPDSETETLQDARIAKDKDVFIISLSIEPAHHQLLRDVSHVVQDIITTINWTSLIACPATVLDSVPKDSQCRDFLFVVDGSDSVLRHKETVRQYLAYTALRYRLVTNAIGVNVYGTNSHLQAADTRIRLKDDKYELADKIRQKLIFPTTGGTGTDRAIIQSLDILNEDHRGRQRALVMITDGPTIDPQATRDAINRARDRGYPVIIIRVGSAMTDEELSFISSGERTNVFNVDNFSQLYGVTIDDRLCNVIEERCSNSCPGNQPLEKCRCGCMNDCPPGQIADIGRNCSCVCVNVCPGGQIADPNNNCNCMCPNKCPNGNSASVKDLCACRSCSNVCPAGQIPDASNNCNCVCANRCSDGQLASIIKNCLCSSCNNNCPTGQSPDPYNSCTCACTNSCSNGHLASLNNNCLCETICSNDCPANLSPDPRTNCSCVCTNACGRGQFPDILKGCRCTCNNTCPKGQIPDPNNDCQCHCGNSCPEGQVHQPENDCRCVCPNRCPEGQAPSIYNKCECKCVSTCPLATPQNLCSCSMCSLVPCPIGQTPDGNTCRCKCSNKCPTGQLADTNTCTCQCLNTCPSGQGPDPANNCTCQERNICSPGQILNALNKCTPQCPACPPGQRVDPSKECFCQCQTSCPNGQVADPLKNCECYCPNTCPVGQLPDASNRCSCQCPNTCSIGQSPNPTNSCSCQCTRNNCPPVTTRQNRETCDCECLIPGVHFNSSTGECTERQCPLRAQDCTYPKVLNNLSCRCTCPRQCPSGARATDQCDCLCPDSRQRYNSRTNQCETSNCLQTCPANSLLNVDCSCSCPLGFNFDVTTRTCVPAETRGRCTGNEFSCENNQVAYRDCNGRCFCACSTLTGFVGSRCEIRLTPELCSDCSYDNGHYHAGVVGYCDMFVMCVPVGGKTRKTRPTSFVPYFMSCPPGTYYITRPDGWTGCDHLTNGRCSSDRCDALAANARYADPSACQSYWQCGSDRRLSSKECCPAGGRFDPGSSSCVVDGSCPVTCGPNRTHDCLGDYNRNITGCPYDVNPDNPNEFFYKVLPGLSLHCQPTYIMDLIVCHCVKGSNLSPYVCEATVDLNFEDNPMNNEDSVPRVLVSGGQVANFSGSDNITLKIFAGSGFWTEYFQVSLRLFLSNPVTRGQRIAVVTNADCGIEESVSITMDDSNFYFKILQLNSSQSVEITVPYSGRAGQDGWYSLTLLYRRASQGFQFSGSVGSFTETYTGNIPLTAYIDYRPCALHIGQGLRYSGLTGLVDNFQIWRCDPRTSSQGQSG